MRTLAAKLNDTGTSRYQGDQSRDLDPKSLADAKKILSTAGGAKAAKLAIAELWKQAQAVGGGWLPTARLSAPLRVLQSMVTIGVLEQADDNEERQTVAFRFRLNERGLDAAVAASARTGGDK
jgi:ketopantoate reductase